MFCDLLPALRANAHFDIPALSKLTGLSEQRLISFENASSPDGRIFSYTDVLSCAKAFGLTAEEFVRDAQTMQARKETSSSAASCKGLRILYLDDARTPSQTICNERLLRAEVFLARDLRSFRKILRCGYVPDEVHFDGFLQDGERGIVAVEWVAAAMIRGTLPTSVRVFFHSACDHENISMKRAFLTTLDNAGIKHNQYRQPEPQSVPSANSLNPKYQAKYSQIRTQIQRQKKKNGRP